MTSTRRRSRRSAASATGRQPLGGLTANVSKVTASGESQSCGRLVTYYNKVAPLQEIADNYLLTVCTGAIRADRPEKVLRIISEFENKAQQTEAEAPTNPSPPPLGGGRRLARAVSRERELERRRRSRHGRENRPVLEPAAVARAMAVPRQRGHQGARRMVRRRLSAAARAARRIRQLDDAETRRQRQRARRCPPARHEVATGVNRGDNTAAPPPNPYNASAFCTLLGQYKPFSPETLGGLYSDYGDYIDKVKASPKQNDRRVPSARRRDAHRRERRRVPGAAPDGAGADRRLAEHRHLPARAGAARFPRTKCRRWRTPSKPNPKFELQHRNASGEWTPVGGRTQLPETLVRQRAGGDVELQGPQQDRDPRVQDRTRTDGDHALVEHAGKHRGRPDALRTPRRPRPTARRSTPEAAAGSRTRSPCRSPTTATRCCRTAARGAASIWHRCPRRRRSARTARTPRAGRSPTKSATSPHSGS